MAEGGAGGVLTFQRLGEDAFIEELCRVGMDEVRAASSRHDTIGMGIGLHGGDGLREPAQREVHGDGTYILPAHVLEGLAVRDNRLLPRGVVRVVVDERLRPAGAVEQFAELVPVHREVLIVLVSLLDNLYVPFVVVGIGREVTATVGEEIRFEGDGTAVQVGIVHQDLVGIDEHRVRRVEMPGGQPVRVVGGHLHAVEGIGDTLHGVVEHLRGAAYRLLPHDAACLIEHIAE